jgi:hypothetical protein
VEHGLVQKKKSYWNFRRRRVWDALLLLDHAHVRIEAKRVEEARRLLCSSLDQETVLRGWRMD